MARIRTIKPEFWQDYRLATDLTRDQRLLYIALWNEADDEGRLPAHPLRLLGTLFPYDRDLTPEWMEDSLSALERTGRAIKYEVDGEPYIELTKFAKHQTVNRPSKKKHPVPQRVTKGSRSTHGALSEHSPVEQGTGNREREQGKEAADAARHPPSPDPGLVTWLGGDGGGLEDFRTRSDYQPNQERDLHRLLVTGGNAEGYWRTSDGGRVPPPERPALLSQALAEFAAVESKYSPRSVTGFLRKVIEHRPEPSGGGSDEDWSLEERFGRAS